MERQCRWQAKATLRHAAVSGTLVLGVGKGQTGTEDEWYHFGAGSGFVTVASHVPAKEITVAGALERRRRSPLTHHIAHRRGT
jgi:hypothetical protein